MGAGDDCELAWVICGFLEVFGTNSRLLGLTWVRWWSFELCGAQWMLPGLSKCLWCTVALRDNPQWSLGVSGALWESFRVNVSQWGIFRLSKDSWGLLEVSGVQWESVGISIHLLVSMNLFAAISLKTLYNFDVLILISFSKPENCGRFDIYF